MSLNGDSDGVNAKRAPTGLDCFADTFENAHPKMVSAQKIQRPE